MACGMVRGIGPGATVEACITPLVRERLGLGPREGNDGYVGRGGRTAPFPGAGELAAGGLPTAGGPYCHLAGHFLALYTVVLRVPWF